MSEMIRCQLPSYDCFMGWDLPCTMSLKSSQLFPTVLVQPKEFFENLNRFGSEYSKALCSAILAKQCSDPEALDCCEASALLKSILNVFMPISPLPYSCWRCCYWTTTATWAPCLSTSILVHGRQLALNLNLNPQTSQRSFKYSPYPVALKLVHLSWS